MSDFSGESKSIAYDDMLKGEGIRIYISAPHVPQQNGCAERFMRTLMDKAEAMRHCHIPEFDQVQPRPRTTLVHLGYLGLLGSPSVS